jgi:putative two-component system response regulator
VEQPDLVMIDLVLPGLDGASLVERLSSDEATSDIPLMVLSVDADLERVQTLYRVGAKDYLVVPYHMSVLEEKIAKHLAKPRPKREVNVKNSE